MGKRWRREVGACCGEKGTGRVGVVLGSAQVPVQGVCAVCVRVDARVCVDAACLAWKCAAG